ncbi:unnamed protein product [Trichobilharzia szidati]|nr:unnamed protein product [Trichobilharzia szidati]
MTLEPDEVEQRNDKSQRRQQKLLHPLNGLIIFKNRKENINNNRIIPYSTVFLCHLFSVFILSIVTVKCTVVVRLEMDEERENGTLVGLLIKYIPNHITARHKSLLFRPISKDHAYLFYVHPDDGRIYVLKRIDREELCQYKDNTYHRLPSPTNSKIRQTSEKQLENFTQIHHCRLTFSVSIIKTIGSTINIIEVIRVYITVNDIDDNKCVFTPDSKQTIYLPEDLKPDAHIGVELNQPTDLDAHPDHTISSGKILLYSRNSNNGEENLISQSQISNLPFKLIISPTDSLIKPYSLSLYLTEKLDYETITGYNLIVEANSKYGAANQSCFLQLNIIIQDKNDHKPFFSTNYSEINIAENFNISLPLYTFSATDSDSSIVYSKVIYELDKTAEDAIKTTFFINPNSGSVYLKLKLNYKKCSAYTIPVIARNPLDEEETILNGKISHHLYSEASVSFTSIHMKTNMYSTAKLIVNVIDINDHPPVITFQSLDGSSHLMIPEHSSNLPLDFAIISVTDDDDGLNGEVTCSLIGNYTDQFKLTSIITKNNLKTVSFDNVWQSISDERNIWSKMGVIYKLSATVSFDREQTSHFNLTVECYDHGTPQLISSEVIYFEIADINDNKPVFNSSEVHLAIMEDSDPLRRQTNYEIIKMVATDNDFGNNSLIKYYLKGDDRMTEHFRIDESTGVIRSNGNLDRETSDRFEFVAVAQDCGFPSLSNSVTIQISIRDYNDEQPKFQKQVYEFHINENNRPDQYIGSITCSDRDIGSNGLVYFEIESIHDTSHAHHTTDHFIFSAALYQSSFTDEHFINVSSRLDLPFEILNYFDTQKNVYLVKIYAKSKLDREVLLKTSELVKPSTFSLSSSLAPSSSSSSRKLYNENLKILERFDKRDDVGYKFWIMGGDQGQPQQHGRALVHVIIDDENDNRPHFVKPKGDKFLIELSYLERVRNPIYKLLAMDDDAGKNGTVRYEIQYVTVEFSPDVTGKPEINAEQNFFLSNKLNYTHQKISKNSLFSLNPLSGLLRLNTQFSQSDINKVFTINIKAYDLGIPHSEHSYISLHIKVVNSTPSETKRILDSFVDEEDENGAVENQINFYTKWKSHSQLSMNSFIILSTVTVSFVLSVILVYAIGYVLRRRRAKQDSTQSKCLHFIRPVEQKSGALLFEDGYQYIDIRQKRNRLNYDDNQKNISSPMQNQLNEIARGELSSTKISAAINYNSPSDDTPFSPNIDNLDKFWNISDGYRSHSQTEVLSHPLIVHLEPISTRMMDTNFIQPITILYPTHSEEHDDLISIHLNATLAQSTSCHHSNSSDMSLGKPNFKNSNGVNDLCSKDFKDFHSPDNKNEGTVQFSIGEFRLNELQSFDDNNSLRKPKTSEFQHACFHAQLTKRNSLSSVGQDSGNGDSLETTTVSLIPVTRPTCLDNSLKMASTEDFNKQPVNLSLIHLFTPLSSVKEIDN